VTKIFFIVFMTAVSSVAFGQGHHPYAGLEQRAVKALSEQQIADLKAGRGMGFALPAELNGYPGPSHVLENADALGLTAEQRERTKGLFDSMKAEAVPVGERLIDQETKLDRLFAAREITPATLGAVTEEIGTTQARLRQIHLKYHLTMMDVLSPSQVERYRELRGYGVKADQLHHPRSQH
jgi:Spy/CpxP family protein refolding chaperone